MQFNIFLSRIFQSREPLAREVRLTIAENECLRGISVFPCSKDAGVLVTRPHVTADLHVGRRTPPPYLESFNFSYFRSTCENRIAATDRSGIERASERAGGQNACTQNSKSGLSITALLYL